jgi:DNA-binding Xre family transcriptional regulator
MKTDNKRIGYNLRGAVLRYMAKNYGVRQSDITASAGLHPVSLSRILNGEGTTFETIEKICSVVGGNPSKIIEKGSKTPKYTAKNLEEIVGDIRVLRQYVGPTNQAGLDWATEKLWNIVITMKNHRQKIQDRQAYRV